MTTYIYKEGCRITSTTQGIEFLVKDLTCRSHQQWDETNAEPLQSQFLHTQL